MRVVPPAHGALRRFLEPGVILMPSYVNIGARVGSGTMVDTWATVGIGAQIGRDVHLAGGVGIGGVLEPPGARPVIIEDGAFIGSRCIVTEGVVVEREAVIGAGRGADRVDARSSTSPAPSRSSTAAASRPARSSSPAPGRRSSRPARTSCSARS